MFAIHSSSGRIFSGPLENLRRVEKTAQSNATRRVSDTEIELLDGDNKGTVNNDPQRYTAGKKATQQYLSLLENQGQRGPVYHAHQIMSASVHVIQGGWSLAEVIETFKEYPYQVFPITNEHRVLIGILSRQELYEFMLDTSKYPKSSMKSVADCFLNPKSKVYSADPVTDVRRIATLFVEKNLGALPIADDAGYVLGVVSRTDILKCTVTDPPLSLWC